MGLGYGGVGKMVYETLVDYQKARVAFIDSVGTLLQKDDPMVLQTFLDADLVGLLTRPLIQGGSYWDELVQGLGICRLTRGDSGGGSVQISSPPYKSTRST